MDGGGWWVNSPWGHKDTWLSMHPQGYPFQFWYYIYIYKIHTHTHTPHLTNYFLFLVKTNTHLVSKSVFLWLFPPRIFLPIHFLSFNSTNWVINLPRIVTDNGNILANKQKQLLNSGRLQSTPYLNQPRGSAIIPQCLPDASARK